MRCTILFILFSVALLPTIIFSQIPHTLSYQGVLTDSLGNPKPDGTYTMTFRLYDAETSGSAVWTEVKTIDVKRGLFTTVLGDQVIFGAVVKFDKQYWLSVQVASQQELSPRIPLSAVGYSLNALKADTAQYARSAPIQMSVDSARFAATISDGAVTTSKIGDSVITGNKIVNSQVVRSINAKRDNVVLAAQGGATITSSNDTIIINAGSGGGGTGIQGVQNTNNTLDIINPNGPTATVNVKNGIFLPLTGGAMTGAITNTGNPSITMGKGNFGSGNTNTGTFSFVAGQNNTASGINSVISGGANNIASIDRASVGGGTNNTASGLSSRVGGGEGNVASGNTSTISGGLTNNALAQSATISGGEYNTATAAGSTIGGGSLNKARGLYSVVSGGGGGTVIADSNSALGNYSTIGGGRSNHASNVYSTVAGGFSNEAIGIGATVGGGMYNNVRNNYSVVSGGFENLASGELATVGGGNMDTARGNLSTVIGGQNNTASGLAATVAGGMDNTAGGFYSFAAGHRAKSSNGGSFVWGDATEVDVVSDTTNQFKIRAANGVNITSTAGSTKEIRKGDYYGDNAIVAWGRVVGSTGDISTSKYGVTSAVRNSAGNYTITVNAPSSSYATLVPIANAETDSPPNSAATARFVTIDQLTIQTFSVYITNGSYVATDNDFTFIVTGR